MKKVLVVLSLALTLLLGTFNLSSAIEDPNYVPQPGDVITYQEINGQHYRVIYPCGGGEAVVQTLGRTE